MCVSPAARNAPVSVGRLVTIVPERQPGQQAGVPVRQHVGALRQRAAQAVGHPADAAARPPADHGVDLQPPRQVAVAQGRLRRPRRADLADDQDPLAGQPVVERRRWRQARVCPQPASVDGRPRRLRRARPGPGPIPGSPRRSPGRCRAAPRAWPWTAVPARPPPGLRRRTEPPADGRPGPARAPPPLGRAAPASRGRRPRSTRRTSRRRGRSPSDRPRGCPHRDEVPELLELRLAERSTSSSWSTEVKARLPR